MIDKRFWQDKKVFITGHTGFKGAWLCLWLHSLGAKVTGYALQPPTEPSLFELCEIDKLITSIIADVRNKEILKQAILNASPEIIIHMAAQPLVQDSYKNPVETYEINVIGTVNLLEAVRVCKGIRAVINVTTDKCYENKEWVWGYRENEPLGGYDPYSSSKACSELVTAAYRSSFFNPRDYASHGVAIASARAGNVIGGGDWANGRLVPDCIKAILKEETIIIRNPNAIRPWQHVLEPLSGYLTLAYKLYENGSQYAEGWNFGPDNTDTKPVEWIVNQLCEKWGHNASYKIDKSEHPHEAHYLKLDCSKAKDILGWAPKWSLENAIDSIIEWIDAYKEQKDLKKVCLKQIERYSVDMIVHRGTEAQGFKSLDNLKSVTDVSIEEILREKAIIAAIKHYEVKHKKDSSFKDGDRIPYAGRVFDEKEISALIDSSLDFWLTTGRYAERFEKEFAEFLGIRYCSLTNSGSSANLLAFMALTSPKLGQRMIKKGDEVITVAAGFPTTVAPIIQYGAIPVFVDITFPTYNIDCLQLTEALSEKTKAVMLAHTLGNPFDLQTIKDFCDKHKLWLIEDNCDSLGSKYCYNGQWKYTGTIGHIGTSSFYPPHHITMGEGGAVYTNDMHLKRIMESFRDWGRDCWCAPGHDNTCNNRFGQQFGELPSGYDHKYVYSHFGYNLKVTDMQAAIGCAQIEKLPKFIETRKQNWNLLHNGLADLMDKFILPESTKNSDPSWFGFLLTVKENAGFTRDEIVNYLESKGIQTRMLFAGNLIKHPCFNEIRNDKNGYRIVGNLENTDKIMRDTFWIGVYPGMIEGMIENMIENIRGFTRIKNTKVFCADIQDSNGIR